MTRPGVLTELDRYAPEARPGAVVAALRQLARRAGSDLILVAILSWEAHDGAYWSTVPRPSGEAYLTEEEFFTDVLQVLSWRTALKRIALGRALAALPEGDRERRAQELTEVGVARATILVPVLEQAVGQPKAIEAWIDRARDLSKDDLQRAVSESLGVRAPGGGPPADRVLLALRSAMPDLEARELLEDFLRAGRQVAETDSTVGVLLAGFRECLGAWLPKVGP